MHYKIDFLWSQLRSWKTSRQIVVIESDDWGSERIPNNNVRNTLISIGINMDSNPHATYDTLERFEDLEVLESILQDLYMHYQKKVKITANFITANPDFHAIKATNFTQYFYEPFTDTYQKKDRHTKVIEYIHKLIHNGFMQPQLHGREHINVSFWLEELRNDNEAFLAAFDNKCYSIDAHSAKKSKNLMAALDFENEEQLAFIKKSIIEGHKIFKNTFGITSDTFIAPRYVWSEKINETLVQENIFALQSALYQQSASENNKRYVHFTGQKNKNHPLTYLVRNVFFEPAYGNTDWVNAAFRKVELAFRFRTPAIISMHRINFVGGLDTNQRDKNLYHFKLLLEKIIQKYPNVEFLSSDELVKLI